MTINFVNIWEFCIFIYTQKQTNGHMIKTEKIIDKLPKIETELLTKKDGKFEWVTAELDWSKVSFIDDEGRFNLSGEHEVSQMYICDYYGEFRGNRPWINPVLEQWAEQNGYFWDWMNPAGIYLCEA